MGWVWRRVWALLLVTLLAGGAAGEAHPLSASPLSPAVCIARVQPHDSAEMMFARSELMSGFRAKPDRGDRITFRMTSVWQDGAAIYARYADGSVTRQDFSSATAHRFLTIGAIFEIPLPWREAAVTGILVKTRNSANVRGIVFGAQISSERESTATRASWTALYSGFAGVSLALLVYHFALWVALRHRFQLYYCGMIAAMGLYTFSSSGALILAFPDINNLDRLRINYVLLAATAAMAILFIRNFFEPRVITRPLRFLSTVAASGMAVSSLAFAIFAPWQIGALDRLYFSTFLGAILCIVPVIASAVRNRSEFAGLFFLAWSAPFAAALARNLHGFGLVPYSFWLDNSTVVALCLEALLSSLAISARIRVLSKERDDARAEEIVAKRLASHDPLTGLLNRRGFMEAGLGKMASRTLLLLDLDNFKQVNDRFGHHNGDEVLRHFGSTLSKWSGGAFLVARIGGEEFAVLGDETKLTRKRINMLLETIRSADPPIPIRVTASIGVASGLLDSDEGWKTLYRNADMALYRAKADGRDRICVTTKLAKAA
jgi:diguanylate cyclase (GGDEF)-like protein